MTDETVILEYRDKWLANGYNTELADMDFCKSAAAEAFEAKGKPFPEVHIMVPSIHAMALIRMELLDPKYAKYNTAENAHLLPAIVESLVNDMEEIGTKYGPELHMFYNGNFASFGAGVLDLGLSEVDDITISDKPMAAALVALAKVCSGFLPYDHACIYADRAELICNTATDKSKEYLHSATGPAIKWRCGLQEFYFDNRHVPDEWILNPENITADDIANQGNEELKRIMIELYGPDKFIGECELIDKSDDLRFGELYAPPGSNIVNYLKVTNQSKDATGQQKEYVLNVFTEHETAKAANASTWGLDEKDFNPAHMA